MTLPIQDRTQSGRSSAFTSRAMTNDDDGGNFICGSAQVATINTGLQVNWGVAFKGIITFAGSATVNDVRTTGATNPWCAVVNIGADVYDCVGTKA